MRLKDKRALSSVIGALFLVVVLSASIGVIFAYQGYFAGITREGMRSQQAITERIRENLEVTLLVRSQDSAMLQIENTGLVTAKVTRAVIKDPDTGRSQILPLTYQLTLLPNEKQVVVVSIPNGNEKIGLITERGKLYGAIPAPRMIILQSTTTGETNLNNPQPPASPTPSNPSNPSPSPPSVSGSQPPVTPTRPDNQQQEERVTITLYPLRSNPYIETIVQYVTERIERTVKEPDRYIWEVTIPGEPGSTTYTMTVQNTEWMNPTIVSRAVSTSSQTQTFTEGSNPPFGDFIQQQLRNLAVQVYGESFVESQEWLRSLREQQSAQGHRVSIPELWWVDIENYVVSGSLESGTVTLRVPTTLFGTATITFIKQTTPRTEPYEYTVATNTPERPEAPLGAEIKLLDVEQGETRTETIGFRGWTIEREVQTGTVLLDNTGNAWNVFRDPSGQPVLVRGSPERTGEYTVSARDANNNIVWLKPEDADRLMSIITGQAENPGAIGGELPGTPQFDENGNLMGFVVERRETVTSSFSSSSGSSSSNSNSLGNRIRCSGVAISGGLESAAAYVESQGISSTSELAAAYAASTGASYDQVLAAIESDPAVAVGIAAFLAANS